MGSSNWPTLKAKEKAKNNCDSGTNTDIRLKASSYSSLWRQAHYRNWQQNKVGRFESSGNLGKWSYRESTHFWSHIATVCYEHTCLLKQVIKAEPPPSSQPIQEKSLSSKFQDLKAIRLKLYYFTHHWHPMCLFTIPALHSLISASHQLKLWHFLRFIKTVLLIN